ncbi:hypothetical protein [Methanomethylovorans sp.]|uniref:hypothetical protein n=1 Tax=Methanomethylovorans sp. TaxID=2758717 RepID=UPI00351C5C62
MKALKDNSEQSKSLQTQAMYLIGFIGAIAGLILNSPPEPVTLIILNNATEIQNFHEHLIEKINTLNSLYSHLPDIEYAFLFLSIISLSIALLFAVMAFDPYLPFTDRERDFLDGVDSHL